VLALSVDPPEVTAGWAADKGFDSFVLLSDPEMQVIDAWDLRNPDEPGLAHHAVYIIDTDGTILYRKIARRRTRSPELLSALDREAVECCPSLCAKGEPVCRPIE